MLCRVTVTAGAPCGVSESTVDQRHNVVYMDIEPHVACFESPVKSERTPYSGSIQSKGVK